MVQGNASLTEIKAAPPYYDNALCYSFAEAHVVDAVIQNRIWHIVTGENSKVLHEPDSQPAKVQADYDLNLYCPLLRDLVQSQIACSQSENPSLCANGLPTHEDIMLPLVAADKRHTCQPLADGIHDMMVSQPVAVDLADP